MKTLKKHSLLFSICAIVFIMAITAHPVWGSKRSSKHKPSCQIRIKQTLIMLHVYAADHQGWFPDKNGNAGLRQLLKHFKKFKRKIDYAKLLQCPNVKTAKDGEITYEYRSGYRLDSNKNIAIIFDRQDNHKDMGNIGFVDGSVKSFEGKDWRKNINVVNKK